MPLVRKRIEGSHRTPLAGAKPVGKIGPNERMEVTVYLRSRATDPKWGVNLIEMGSKRPDERTYLSREALAADRGADPEDVAKIDAFAHAYRLTVVDTNLARRSMQLSGTTGDFCRAFGVQLHRYESKEGTYRGRTGYIYVPGELTSVIEGLFGLDNRSFGKPSYRGRLNREVARSTDVFSVPQIAEFYNFPSNLNGNGQCIAVIELNDIDVSGNVTGTGYTVSDLQRYFKRLDTPMPEVAAIGVDGGRNVPGSDQVWDTEVTIDIEILGAIAPKAKLAVYFAPDTDAGFINCVSTAVHDTVRKPSVVSISWGNPEDSATDQFLKAFSRVLEDAAAMGVTVCCETGDYGSSDQPSESRDGSPHVEFPASNPYVLACGGTMIVKSGKATPHEAVWNEGDNGGAGGGGVSNKFLRPKYQKTLKIPLSPQGRRGRGVPDVAGNAVGYQMLVRGKKFIADGTSAATPLWAGLISLINQSLVAKRGNTVGFLNPLIYGPLNLDGAFNGVVEGNNDIDGKLNKYSASRGWNPCTGMGSPNGVKLLRLLRGERLAPKAAD